MSADQLLVQRPLLNLALRLSNSCYRQARSTLPVSPRKILLANIAHFGDVVISTAVLAPLRQRFPQAEIHFLASSATSAVVESHPMISKVFAYDHWVFAEGWIGKCKAALHSPKRLIEAEAYDLAIDLYPYFPNAVPLLASAQIPARVGFTSGGFGRLLTHPHHWNLKKRYIAHAQLELLEILGIDVAHARPLPDLRGNVLPPRQGGGPIVVHMGSGNPFKEWPEERWIEVIRRLPRPVVLTGKGRREAAICARVAAATGAETVCDRLSWNAFVEVIHSAQLLLTVDSAAVHVAAAREVPQVALYAGVGETPLWTPAYPGMRPLVHSVPCSPCFRKKGGRAMNGIREISVKEVLRAVEELLEGAHAFASN
jgi:ADP-heptose:LPS heptosyltransferase